MLTAPGGKPAASAASAMKALLRGSSSGVLVTTALPAARAAGSGAAYGTIMTALGHPALMPPLGRLTGKVGPPPPARTPTTARHRLSRKRHPGGDASCREYIPNATRSVSPAPPCFSVYFVFWLCAPAGVLMNPRAPRSSPC